MGPKGVGTFTAGRTTYAFSRTDTGEGQLFLFHPAPQTSLTDLQLEGTIRQMRQLMAEFLTQIGPMTEGGEGKLSTAARENFSKSYHRMFRLLNNLDFVTSAAGPDRHPLPTVRIRPGWAVPPDRPGRRANCFSRTPTWSTALTCPLCSSREISPSFSVCCWG